MGYLVTMGDYEKLKYNSDFISRLFCYFGLANLSVVHHRVLIRLLFPIDIAQLALASREV